MGAAEVVICVGGAGTRNEMRSEHVYRCSQSEEHHQILLSDWQGFVTRAHAWCHVNSPERIEGVSIAEFGDHLETVAQLNEL